MISSGFRRKARALLALLLLFAAAPALADDDAVVAKKSYDTGMAHFHLEEWDAAITDWEAGFRTRPVPEFLFNIAQAYRLSRRPEKALSFYQKYLLLAPQAPNRGVVERHISALKKEVERLHAAPTPADNPQPPPPVVITPPVVVPTQTRTDLVVTTAPAERPVYKRAWFWGVMGGAAAVVITAVVVGVVVGGHSDGPQMLKPVSF